MNRLLATLAALLAGCSAMPHRESSLATPDSLAAAETSFAAQSVREGMRAAFLAWLAPEATLYQNGPVNGPELIAARPDPPIVLDWRPVFVEVAGSGEIGLSTGPWTITSRKDPTTPARHGQFVTVWKRSPPGPWRVRVDLGISHPGAALADTPLETRTTPPAGASGNGGTLADAEAAFAGRARESGDAAAYSAWVSAAVRLYREGHAPYLGRRAALASPVVQGGHAAWVMETHEVSRSGDFGYATGRYAAADGATAGYFVRVWRREPEGWRIALDVTSAAAPR